MERLPPLDHLDSVKAKLRGRSGALRQEEVKLRKRLTGLVNKNTIDFAIVTVVSSI